MKLTFLGTGTSHGLPYIGCECDVCTSSHPKNKRLRCSILVEDGSIRLLIDTSPDLRQQLLREKISWISAVLWTHIHNDHVIGLDDLRSISDRCGYLPTYGDASTLSHLKNLFGYAFVQGRDHAGFPRLRENLIAPRESFAIGNFRITPIPIMHGKNEILAFRFEDGKSTLIYATDCSAIPDESWELMKSADVLILDALRHRPHPTHFSIEEAVDAIQILAPRRAFFTHIAHDLDHDTTNASLPVGIELAYDGLSITL